MAEWWESDEKIHEESSFGIWWMGTKKNARRGCPDLLAGAVSFGAGSFSTISTAGESLGLRTPLSIIHGAGTKSEIGLATMATGIFWCGGNYIGGAADSFYQLSHHGDHLLGTRFLDWYITNEEGVDLLALRDQFLCKSQQLSLSDLIFLPQDVMHPFVPPKK